MAFQTSNQKKDEAERTAKNIVEDEISKAKAAPDKHDPEAPIRYKERMTRENAALDRKRIEEREEEVEKNSEEASKMPGSV